MACVCGQAADRMTRIGGYIGGPGGSEGTPNLVRDLTLTSGRKLGDVQVVDIQRSFIKVVPVANTKGPATTVFRTSLPEDVNNRFPYREKTPEEKARELQHAAPTVSRTVDVATQSPRPAETPAKMLSRAEAALRQGDDATTLLAFNYLLDKFPGSHEASTVAALVKFVRQQGTTPYAGTATMCTAADVQSIKTSFDSMDSIAKSYHTAPADKRQAIDTLFGPATFSDPDLSLDGLLNAMRQMQAARQKAVRGE
jgi:hypothetical protein